MLGYPNGDLVGRDFFETCVPEAERAERYERYRDNLDTDEPIGDDPKQLVPECVAEAVVDELEVVEVDIEQNERLPTHTGEAELDLKAPLEMRSIGQSRQRVQAMFGWNSGEGFHPCGSSAPTHRY
jgi:hypothetical protein